MIEHEVTLAMWDRCTAAGVCSFLSDEGWGRENRPITTATWNEVETYLHWLNQISTGNYRLPSESEWEYTARAGGKSKYSWDDNINCPLVHYRGCSRGSLPVKSFSANAWGIYDMHGNASEWACGLQALHL